MPQARARLSLTSAKQFVDLLPKGETVTVAMASTKEATQLAKELTTLGAKCVVRTK